jgi:hypothetical protein
MGATGHYTIKQNGIIVLQALEGMPEFGYVMKKVCIEDLNFLLPKKMTVKCFGF